MGFHGTSFGSLLLISIIAVLLFGTKRLRTMGEDLGAAIKSFQKGLRDEEPTTAQKNEDSKTISSNNP